MRDDIDYLIHHYPLSLIAIGVVLVIALIWLMIRDIFPGAVRRHSRPLTPYLRKRRIARHGNPKACVEVADMLEKGTGGAHHHPGAAQHWLDMALYYYNQMAKNGDGHAYLKMAEICNRGMAPDTFSKQADRYYHLALKTNERAAQNGDVNGLAFAGYQYRFGLGCISDYDKAAHYLEGAANLGHTPSMRSLAELYLQGYKSKPDPIRAAALYRQAALQGDAVAREQVGDNYVGSIGEPASRELAYYWYAHAARQGRHEAQVKLQKLEEAWTPKQLREVQDRLTDWVPA